MTKIEWTEATWNPVVGCSILSPGCTNCYAMKMAARIEAMGTAPHYSGTTKRVNGKAVWTGKLALAPERILTEPLRRKKPTKYFVNSMSDLFHEDVPEEWIDGAFAVMALAPQHTFQVLTKRSARMRAYLTRVTRAVVDDKVLFETAPDIATSWAHPQCKRVWPLPNVWLGVSTERQQEANERIPDLLATPAAVRFVSAEPLLGPIDFTNLHCRKCGPHHPYCREDSTFDALGRGIDWMIVGGESGSGARPMYPGWAESIRDQCADAAVPFFFKQWGNWRPWMDGDDADEANGIVMPDGRVTWTCGGDEEHALMYRRTKSESGRLLDGREWNEMPGASKYDQAPTDPHHGGKIWA